MKAQQTVYFGKLLGRDGVQADLRKTKAITYLAYPTTKHELQPFLGMVNFLTQFIPYLSDKTAPLHELLKKEAVFNFDENYKSYFDNVKDAVKDSETLGLYDPEEDLVLEVNASTKDSECASCRTAGQYHMPANHSQRLNPTIVTLNMYAYLWSIA